jgi:hypothetical protein
VVLAFIGEEWWRQGRLGARPAREGRKKSD